ncbi:ubiquitin ligase (cullin) of SCF [Stygiomarasmius scandens]|uniref:Ubiquitin ligase (Cullin) of SCF n=1 Tax=Marasmiellus scandens TaxID=2682957 RepID=A0ABR1IYE1_9AGAR
MSLSTDSLPSPRAAPSRNPEEIWSFLHTGMDRIMNEGPRAYVQNMHMYMYTAVYDYIALGKLIDGPVKSGLPSSLAKLEGARLHGERLYVKVGGYLKDYLKRIIQAFSSIKDPEALLQYYNTQWEQYSERTKYISHLFSCFNRHWVASETRMRKKAGDFESRPVYSIDTLALILWNEHVFLPLQNQENNLTEAIIHLVNQERDGKTIDQNMIKNTLSSFFSIDIHAVGGLDCRHIYKNHFLVPFIRAMEIYYRSRSASFLEEHTTVEYVEEAQEWLRSEEARIEAYLCMNKVERRDVIKKFDVLVHEYGDRDEVGLESKPC